MDRNTSYSQSSIDKIQNKVKLKKTKNKPIAGEEDGEDGGEAGDGQKWGAMIESAEIPTLEAAVKKHSKSCLVIVLVLLFLCIGATALMAVRDICPPTGPWPQPPWCDGSEVAFVPFDRDDIELLPVTPRVSLTVSVPANTPEGTVVYVEFYDMDGTGFMNEAMTEREPNVWTYASTNLDWEVEQRGAIHYRYTRNNFGYWQAEEFIPDSPTAFHTLSEDAQDVQDVVAKWRWMPAPGETLPEVTAAITPFEPRMENLSFQKGMLHADWWWDAFEPLIPSTNARMLEQGITWVELSPTWDYTQVLPTPVISNQVGHAYPDDKLRLHIEGLQADGFELFFLPQICCTMVDGAAMTPEWWDAWYEEYKKFLFYHIDIANEYGIEYISLNSDGFVHYNQPEGYAERLDAIYDEAQARYHGKMGMMFYIFGSPAEGKYFLSPYEGWVPELERWDFFGFSWWAGISSNPEPTAEELDANVETIFRTVLQPLYDRYGVPMVFTQVAYTSVDGGLMGEVDVFDVAIQLWEPYADKYTLDLEEQAMGYDAILRGIARHDYVIGVYPFAYLPDSAPLTLEFNVRDKPAEQILRQWYETIP